MDTFGTQFMPEMSLAEFDGKQWGEYKFVDSSSLNIHPGSHVLHYSSTCFEGLKAFKHEDGSVHIFRVDNNVRRLAQSSELLCMPKVDESLLKSMILDVTRKYLNDVPPPSGAMYIRPTHIGTDRSIGKAAEPSLYSMMYVLLSPVGDYFKGGYHPLRLLLETSAMRSAPHMGMVKSGGNYASALMTINQAKKEHGANQVLFCPDGKIQETGAANFILIDENRILTKSLDSTILHGITRNSLLTLAEDSGMEIVECDLHVDELIELAKKPTTEAALTGTALVLSPVGQVVLDGKEHTIGSGLEGPVTTKLRKMLNDLQWGLAEDKWGWLTKV